MIKYSIVMTHYERVNQTKNTLDSLAKYLGSRDDYEIIIVDDFSENFKELREIVSWYSLNIKLIGSQYYHKEKTWFNPCIPFNIGLKQTQGQVVIIQNAENIWRGNILEYLDNSFSKNDYICFACYSLSKHNTENKIYDINGSLAGHDGANGWYQHSRINNRWYHFCVAISKENLEKIGYFDEDFKDGVGYDDDYLVYNVKKHGLNMVAIDDPYVCHQFHYYPSSKPNIQAKSNYELYLSKTNQ